MATKMRAKFYVSGVQEFKNEAGDVIQETVSFNAVSASSYPEDGSDEDNTYAKYSPSASCTITIANPALFGAFASGDKMYVDFTPVEEAPPAEEKKEDSAEG